MSHSADEHDAQLPEVLMKETLTVPGLGEGQSRCPKAQNPLLAGDTFPSRFCFVPSAISSDNGRGGVFWAQRSMVAGGGCLGGGASTQSPCAEGFALDRNYNPSGPTQNHWAGKRRVPG